METKLKEEFFNTVLLLKKYMESERPQSFASVYRLYQSQKKKCRLYGINISDMDDERIDEYAKKEHIERFSFHM